MIGLPRTSRERGGGEGNKSSIMLGLPHFQVLAATVMPREIKGEIIDHLEWRRVVRGVIAAQQSNGKVKSLTIDIWAHRNAANLAPLNVVKRTNVTAQATVVKEGMGMAVVGNGRLMISAAFKKMRQLKMGQPPQTGMGPAKAQLCALFLLVIVNGLFHPCSSDRWRRTVRDMLSIMARAGE